MMLYMTLVTLKKPKYPSAITNTSAIRNTEKCRERKRKKEKEREMQRNAEKCREMQRNTENCR